MTAPPTPKEGEKGGVGDRDKDARDYELEQETAFLISDSETAKLRRRDFFTGESNSRAIVALLSLVAFVILIAIGSAGVLSSRKLYPLLGRLINEKARGQIPAMQRQMNGLDFPPPLSPIEKIISDEKREGARVRAETKAGRVGSRCNSRNNGTTCPVTARGSQIPALAGKPKGNKVAPGEFLIPRTIIQSHESWDTYIRDNAYLAGAVQELRSKCHESGWEYRFFDAEARTRFFEMDPVIRQLGLVIETEAPASRADDQEKSLYQQILRLGRASWLAAFLWRTATVSEISAQDPTTRNLLQTQQTGLRIWLSTELDKETLQKEGDVRANKNDEKNYFRRTVSISELYHSLTDGVAKADLFKYSYVYAYGGVYLDTKSGFEEGFSLDDAIFGKPEQDGKRPRALMKILLSNWGLRYCDFILPKPAGVEKHCEEYAQWIIAAQPRHRYLFRVIEQVARNIFFLKRSKQLAGQSSFLVDSGFPFHHFPSPPLRVMQVLVTTGPVAFTNAITKEQNRQLHLLRLDTEGEDGAARLAADAGFPNPLPNDVQELGIRFSNIRDSSGGLVARSDWDAVKSVSYEGGCAPIVKDGERDLLQSEDAAAAETSPLLAI